MSPAYLIYHPAREKTVIGKLTIYHDEFGGNEDPYLWNDQFLHSFCHITQLPNQEGQVNFWISGDIFPNFNHLFCDCVFVIEEKHFWAKANEIDINDPIVDDEQTFHHHYKWPGEPNGSHKFLKRRRYTLKADRRKSYQPQNAKKELVDILPFLIRNGYSREELISAITSDRGSRPMKLSNLVGIKLYEYLKRMAPIKLTGTMLKSKHPYGANSGRAKGC